MFINRFQPMLRRTILTRFFDLLYTRLAWGYDAVAWGVSAGRWYEWGRATLPLVSEGPLLEVGCGRGHLLGPLAERAGRAVGVDRSLEMVHAAARRSGQPAIQADGRALPFRAGTFATLVTVFPAPYILEPATQREFARVVRPGGLWLWADAPELTPTRRTQAARLITRAAYGAPHSPAAEILTQERSGGLWAVKLRQVLVGPTTIMVRVARRVATEARGRGEEWDEGESGRTEIVNGE